MSQTLVVIATCFSAAAAIAVAIVSFMQWNVGRKIAALNEILATETRRYAAATEKQLGILLEQWSKDSKPWLFFDLETDNDKLILHCVNAGKPTLYLSQAKLHTVKQDQVGFSLIHRIGIPLRSGEHYAYDLGPATIDSIKRSLSIGRGYVEPPNGLACGASCQMIVEYYDDGSPQHVGRYFPLQLHEGIWNTEMPPPMF